MSIRRNTESFPGRTLVTLLRGRIQQEPSKKVYTWPEFSVAALNAAKTLQFTPAQKDGQPVEAWTQIAISPAQ